jgi:hypothetical protein
MDNKQPPLKKVDCFTETKELKSKKPQSKIKNPEPTNIPISTTNLNGNNEILLQQQLLKRKEECETELNQTEANVLLLQEKIKVYKIELNKINAYMKAT